jgi:5S rRNA maturation endonuclease (ribonuclease M5)
MIRRLNALPKARGVKISADKQSAVMVCQFHYIDTQKNFEKTSSFKINLVNNGKYRAGTARCFGCGTFVKDFAVILDPSKAGTDITLDEDSDEYAEPLYNERSNLILYDDDSEGIQLPNAIPWLAAEDWRSISGKLLKMIDAKLIFEEEYQNLMLYLPCVVNKEHIGGVRANLVKRGKRNYFNLPGDWVKEKALFPLDFTKKLIKKRGLSTIVLVEGPRDALRCLQYGIPAVGILGSGNWSDTKSDMVAALNPVRIITAFDGDKAGRGVTKKVYETFKGEFAVFNFRFDKYGEDLDPGNAPPKIMKKLRSYCI